MPMRYVTISYTVHLPGGDYHYSHVLFRTPNFELFYGVNGVGWTKIQDYTIEEDHGELDELEDED